MGLEIQNQKRERFSTDSFQLYLDGQEPSAAGPKEEGQDVIQQIYRLRACQLRPPLTPAHLVPPGARGRRGGPASRARPGRTIPAPRGGRG